MNEKTLDPLLGILIIGACIFGINCFALYNSSVTNRNNADIYYNSVVRASLFRYSYGGDVDTFIKIADGYRKRSENAMKLLQSFK